MAEITIKNVVKEYGDGFLAVNDVSLDIADGEFMILVGPSGCGKSTLLRMIVGLEDITSGDLLIGEAGERQGPRDRNLAMVFQNYALYPHLTGVREHRLPAAPARRDVRGRDHAKVERRRPRPSSSPSTSSASPANLSGGQRQRVAMGRAIVREADAFLFDEPLSNLDAKLRGQMRTEILRMQRRMGTTTVYVTHDQTEAMTLGDRVAVLRKGPAPAGGDAPRALRAPGEHVRGRLHRFAADELRPRRSRGRHPRTAVRVVRPARRHAARRSADRTWSSSASAPSASRTLVDRSKRSGGVTFRRQVDVIEWLGNEQYAYIP